MAGEFKSKSPYKTKVVVFFLTDEKGTSPKVESSLKNGRRYKMFYSMGHLSTPGTIIAESDF